MDTMRIMENKHQCFFFCKWLVLFKTRRFADSSTNQRLTFVCSPVQQWLRACVWFQWGELPEWVLPAAGCLQTSEWDTCGVWRIMCHRCVCDLEDSLQPSEWVLNPKTMSCCSCYRQINNSNYWLDKPLILLNKAYIILILCHLAFQITSGKEKIYHKDVGRF